MIPKKIIEAFEQGAVGVFRDNCSTNATVSTVADIKTTSPTSIVATIGFACDIAKGAVLVVTQSEYLRKSHPMTALGETVKDSDLTDWIGEIANQTLGRFKNSIVNYGITINMSVPSILKASDVSLAEQAKGERIMRAVRTESGLVFGFSLDIAFARGFDVSVIDQTKEANNTAKEGDSFLF